MGERLRTSGVPGWAWGIIFTLFLTLASFGVGAIAGNQQMKDDIELNNSAIETKASVERVDAIEKENDRVYDAVLRVEEMMIEHMKHD